MRKGNCLWGLIVLLLIWGMCLTGAGAETLTLPEDTQIIEEEAFFELTSAEEVILPKGIQRIETKAFGNNTSLQRIHLPNSLRYIADDAFAGCPNVTAYCSRGYYAFSWCQAHHIPIVETDEQDFTWELISDTEARLVKWTGDYANAVVPAELYTENGIVRITEIRKFAFSGLEKLKSVYFPDSVTSIGEWCFNGSDAVENVCLPAGLTRLEKGTFSGLMSLKSIDLPDGITSIGESCFNFCTSLENIHLPSGLQIIGESAFCNCAFTELEFPEELKEIKAMAFNYCQNLTAADLPDSVEYLGRSDNEHYHGNVFQGCSSLTRFHYPKSLKEVEDGDSGLGNFYGSNLKEITFTAGTTTIVPYTFARATSLEHLDLPDYITSIGHHAFRYCQSLKTVDLPARLQTLGNNAFEDCVALEEVTFHPGLKRIEDSAFRMCKSLKAADLPDSVEVLGTSEPVFMHCYSLTRAHYPLSLVMKPPYSSPFATCPLTEITFTEGTDSILPFTFSLDTTIEEIVLPASVRFIGSGAFSGIHMERFVIPAMTTEYEYSSSTNPFWPLDGLEIWCEYDSDTLRVAEQYEIPYYYLSLTGATDFPAIMTQGSTPLIYGTVRSNELIRTVTAEIRTASGYEVRSRTVHPDANTCFMGGSFSSSLQLNLLTTGNYTLILKAQTDKSEETFIHKSFRVEEQPPRVRISGRTVHSGLVMRGTDQPVGGKLTSNYPMEQIHIRFTPEEGQPQYTTTSPGSTSFDLSSLKVNLKNLKSGRYTMEIIVRLHNTELIADKAWLHIIPPAGEGTNIVDMEKLQQMLQDPDNAYMIKDKYSYGIGTLVGQATDGVDLFTGMGLFFSNYQDYAEALIRDNFFNGAFEISDRGFFVNLFRNEILEYIREMKGQTQSYEFKGSVESRLWTAFNEENKLTSEILLDDHKTPFPDFGEELLIAWNEAAEEIGNGIRIFSTAQEAYQICKTLLEDCMDDVYYLYTLKTQRNLAGKYQGYFQDAVQELLDAYKTAACAKLDFVIRQLYEKFCGEGPMSALQDLLQGNYHYLSMANLYYEILGYFGAYDGPDLYLSFMVKMELYYASEERFEELWSEAQGQELTEEMADQLLQQYNAAVQSAYRALKSLLDEYPNHTFMRKIDGSLLMDTVTALGTDICPFEQ